MPLETGTFLSDLVASNPVGSDNKSTADDHLRLIKSTLKATFPNLSAAVTPTPAELNRVAGVTSGIQGQLNGIQVQLDSVASSVTTTSPAGHICMWPTATAPAGFLLCNGQTASRSTYAGLFAVLGVLFGAGDGSTTFNLPDYRNRMPIGAGTTYVAAGVGGSADAVVVSHTHVATVSDPGHSHITPLGVFNSAGAEAMPQVDDGPNSGNYTIPAATTGITVANASAGVSGTNANLPPYLGIYFVIKT